MDSGSQEFRPSRRIARGKRVPLAGLVATAISLLAVASALGQDIYWTEGKAGCNGGLVRHRTLGSATTENLIDSSESNVQVLLDGAGHIYWSGYDPGNRGKVRRGSLDKFGVLDVVTVSAPYRLDGFDLDRNHSKIYWIESPGCGPCGGGCPCARFQRANLDGTGVEPVFTLPPSFNNPHSIAVDPGAGKVYWSDRQHSPFLSRVNFDGSNPEPLVTSTAPLSGGINALALDLAAGKIYWIEKENTAPGASRIRRSNLDGTNPEPLIDYPSSMTFPYGLALDPVFGGFYWTLSGICPDGTGKIVRTDFGVTRVDELATSLGFTGGITVVPAPGCSQATSFESLACRLGDAGQTIAGSSGLGALQSGLGTKIGKARGKLDQAQASCAQSKVRPARKGLGKAGGLVGSSLAKIGSRRGRRIIGDTLVAELQGVLTPIRDDLTALRGALTCP